MNQTSADAGAGVTPQAPPASAGPITFTIVCPACRGRDTRIFEGASRPAVAARCPACRGDKTITVYWASSSVLPGVRHVVRADCAPPRCLCGWTIPTRDLLSPQGLFCAGCVRVAPQIKEQGVPWVS